MVGIGWFNLAILTQKNREDTEKFEDAAGQPSVALKTEGNQGVYQERLDMAVARIIKRHRK